LLSLSKTRVVLSTYKYEDDLRVNLEVTGRLKLSSYVVTCQLNRAEVAELM